MFRSTLTKFKDWSIINASLCMHSDTCGFTIIGILTIIVAISVSLIAGQ